MPAKTQTNRDVLAKLDQLYREVFAHDGYGDIRIELRILRRGQKEVIIHCGKQYRFVVDCPEQTEPEDGCAADRAAGARDGTSAAPRKS
jgi:hypothetical protein